MSSSNLTRVEAQARSAALHVERYLVTIDATSAPDLSTEWFGSTTTIQFTSTVSSTFADFLDGQVDQVLVNGAAIDPSHDGARIQLTGLRTDAINEVTVTGRGRYSTSGQGLHRFVDPADQQAYLYTQYEPSDARRVFANFEQPDLKASFEFTVAAPAGWLVLSNQPEIGTEPVAGGAAHHFAPTPRLSTYITAIMAGPYHYVADRWTSADGRLSVDLGLACRRDRAAALDAENLFTLTKQGLDFFNEAFGYDYPWGKYDQIFVPEYNLGAMENPGCVTFTEDYLFRSTATRAQYQGRANTLLHEMSHMWFGDLVTPQWWDDLWLKESFAEYMGAHASIEATEFTDAWVAFAGRRKTWAYNADQLPTTHPIVADIADVEAAKQNFDGITYAKGASVLKQLVHYVGVEAFFAGARDYFAQHAFGATGLADLLSCLEQASGRDLDAWSRAWLQTAGPDQLNAVLVLDGDTIASLAIEQTSVDALSGEPVGRPHVLGVGLYDLVNGALVRRELIAVELAGSGAVIDQVVGQPAPVLVLVNDGDFSYAKVVLDQRSVATALESLGTLTDPLARALLWSQLWSMTRDGLLPVRDYVAAVLAHGGRETDPATLTALLDQAHQAVEAFEAPEHREVARRVLTDALPELLLAADEGSDAQLILARAYAVAAASVPDQDVADAVSALLNGPAPMGLDVSHELRWRLLDALIATGHAGSAQADAQLAEDPSMDGHLEHLRALSSRLDEQHARDLVAGLLTVRAMSNDQIDAALAGLNQPLNEASKELAVGGFAALPERIWAEHSIEIAQRLVRGLFGSGDAGADAEVGRGWLAAHPDAPSALRRIMIELTDASERAQRVQAANAER